TQRSALVQASVSAQSALVRQQPARPACAQRPAVSSQESTGRFLPSSQLRGVPATHVPPRQTLGPVQKLPAPQVVPLATAALTHPRAGSQESVVQALPSAQASAVPARQEPFWQVSAPLQALPSLQDAP